MKKNSKVFALAGIGALALVGGTFAYYSSTQTFNNPFETSNFGTSVVEKFNPSEGQEWVPGATVDKEVYATNTGDGEVWVRVKMEETWKRDGIVLTTAKTGEGDFNPESVATAGDNQKDWDDNDNLDAKKDGLYYNGQTGDGRKEDGSVVYKNFDTDNISTKEPTKKDATWYLHEDGYYYYAKSLLKDEVTKKLLDDVTLCGDADMGKEKKTFAYIVVPKKDREASAMPNYLKDADGNEDGVQFNEDGKTYSWVEVLSKENLPKPMDAPTAESTPDYIKKYEEYIALYNNNDVFTYGASGVASDAQGYANADYELDITIEFVQADEDQEAAKALGWAWNPAQIQEQSSGTGTGSEGEGTNP